MDLFSEIKSKLKMFFCDHRVVIETKAELDRSLFIATSTIECINCKKTFAEHPYAKCCYIYHIHNEIMQEQFLSQLRLKQPITEKTENGNLSD